MSKRILFIGPHRPDRNGSQRFRMEQYFPYLRAQQFTCDYSWFLNEKDDVIFYSSGNWIGKLFIFLKAIRIRLRDVLRAGKYDVIFIQREAFMTGSIFFEKQFARSKAKVIFDFDDAIWLHDVSQSNKKLSWLKNPSKTGDIIKLADEVIVGNSFLASYAKQFKDHIHIIPTVLDTTIYVPSNKELNDPSRICVGWSGSKTTVKHFEILIPVLKKLKEKFGELIYFKQIGDAAFHSDQIEIECSDWNFKTELEELNKIDVGIMPLPDDDWSRGKCGFKALQYMALEIPAVISPVGMNTEIIEHGVNGMLASTDQEWIDCLSELISSPELRSQMGKKGRQTVIEKYSVQSQLGKLISILSER